MAQVKKFKPPPNPVKQSDPRCPDYEEKYGEESWELDALSPDVIVEIIEKKINDLITDRDRKEIEAVKRKVQRHKTELRKIGKNYGEVTKFLTALNKIKGDWELKKKTAKKKKKANKKKCK